MSAFSGGAETSATQKAAPGGAARHFQKPIAALVGGSLRPGKFAEVDSFVPTCGFEIDQ